MKFLPCEQSIRCTRATDQDGFYVQWFTIIGNTMTLTSTVGSSSTATLDWCIKTNLQWNIITIILNGWTSVEVLGTGTICHLGSNLNEVTWGRRWGDNAIWVLCPFGRANCTAGPRRRWAPGNFCGGRGWQSHLLELGPTVSDTLNISTGNSQPV